MTPQSRQRLTTLAGLALLISAATILTAWGFELIGGYVPCPLCLQQRVPYYIGVPLTVVALWLAYTARITGARIVMALFAATMAYGLYLGVYQAGAEWGFWQGPTDCAPGDTSVRDAANFLQTLQTTRIASCTDPALRILGLSFAGWNAVVTLVLTLLGLVAALGRSNRT
ncbi:disulfide bond formation protein B [Amorphus orientalis]|uniref:Disulfide bond formation protein DsbB n=1 Tax=Amorphus orientalis TaxID=649198 RepID=A0AAE4AQZ6_9HYPH|nr:disulfide bond formation protein B [Amorphus orientalis]MDQ0313678.1 disulfide bond formation protein DsbB [Amorphus orientalis]